MFKFSSLLKQRCGTGVGGSEGEPYESGTRESGCTTGGDLWSLIQNGMEGPYLSMGRNLSFCQGSGGSLCSRNMVKTKSRLDT